MSFGKEPAAGAPTLKVGGVAAKDGFLDFDSEENEEAEGENTQPVGRGQRDSVEEVL